MRPAEWEPHAACWLAWPKPEPWRDDLAAFGASYDDLCAAFVAVCRAIGASEHVRVLTHGDAITARARADLSGIDAELCALPYGDIWLRDTAPSFTIRDGTLTAVCAHFNGWGGSYLFDHDPQLGAAIAAYLGVPVHALDMVFEGGALEVDGTGAAITTRQCLLNANRNPQLDEADIDRLLAEAFGVSRVCWLDEGLINDHTDGHVDTLARFVAPGVVAVADPAPGDPNRDVLVAIQSALANFELVLVPSPGAVTDGRGALLPASYLNFYIANNAVVVPVYDAPADDNAVAAIAAAFPERDTVAVDAGVILCGGGAIHCITQQQPSRP